MIRDEWKTIMEAFKSSNNFGDFYEQVKHISQSYLVSFVWTHRRFFEKEYQYEVKV